MLTPEEKAEKLKNINDTMESLQVTIIGNERGMAGILKYNPEDTRVAQIQMKNEALKADLNELNLQKAELSNELTQSP